MNNEEKKKKILEILHHLAKKAEALAIKLRTEDLEYPGLDEPHGVGVFLMMLDAKQISEALEILHKELNFA